jgi:hypothetical protein
MVRLLAKLYSRRTINVNVNIVAAGLLALIPTLGIVKLAEHLLTAGVVSGSRLHLTDRAIISLATLVSDLVFDVGIYYALHWLANHSHKPKRQHQLEVIADAAVEDVPFFRDATKVQFQRMVISPLLYSLWLGTQSILMHAWDTDPVPATVVGFLIAVSIARTLHTLWMVWEERKRRRQVAVAMAASILEPPEQPMVKPDTVQPVDPGAGGPVVPLAASNHGHNPGQRPGHARADISRGG